MKDKFAENPILCCIKKSEMQLILINIWQKCVMQIDGHAYWATFYTYTFFFSVVWKNLDVKKQRYREEKRKKKNIGREHTQQGSPTELTELCRSLSERAEHTQMEGKKLCSFLILLLDSDKNFGFDKQARLSKYTHTHTTQMQLKWCTHTVGFKSLVKKKTNLISNLIPFFPLPIILSA